MVHRSRTLTSLQQKIQYGIQDIRCQGFFKKEKTKTKRYLHTPMFIYRSIIFWWSRLWSSFLHYHTHIYSCTSWCCLLVNKNIEHSMVNLRKQYSKTYYPSIIKLSLFSGANINNLVVKLLQHIWLPEWTTWIFEVYAINRNE